MTLTKDAWLNQYGGLSARDTALLSLAYDILKENTLQSPDYLWGDHPVITPWNDGERMPGIWNWDSAFHAMTVSRYDEALAKSCVTSFLQFAREDGMLPDVIFANGERVDTLSKPPVFPWAVMIVYKRCRDRDFLARCYPVFARQMAFMERERCQDGLFYYASDNPDPGDNYLLARYESGWDNSPRWDEPVIDQWAIDLNCFVVMFCRAMAQMAAELSMDESVIADWTAKGERVARLIEARLFDEAQGCYVDVNRHTGAYSHSLSPASFMPLYIGIASPERAARMHEVALGHFMPGMPTIAYTDPTYCLDYWRGPTWLNVAYFAVMGLARYGFTDTARSIREYLLDMVYACRDEGIYENYDSIAREGLCCKRFSWSCAFVIEFILNPI